MYDRYRQPAQNTYPNEVVKEYCFKALMDANSIYVYHLYIVYFLCTLQYNDNILFSPRGSNYGPMYFLFDLSVLQMRAMMNNVIEYFNR